jgi:hypothetical protein
MKTRRAIPSFAVLVIGLLLAHDHATAQNTPINKRDVTVEVNTGRYPSATAAADEATRLVRVWQRTQRPLQGYQITSFTYQVQTTEHQSWHHYIPIGFGASLPGLLFGSTEYSVEKVKVTITEHQVP